MKNIYQSEAVRSTPTAAGDRLPDGPQVLLQQLLTQIGAGQVSREEAS